jgi:hypothetical protein
MKRLAFLFLPVMLLLSSGLFAQQFVTQQFTAHPFIPHPFVFAGPEGMGGGYAPFALLGGAGLRIDGTHFILDTSASYDNGHKTNDGTQPNPKGHDRGLAGSAYYRLASGWFLGAGARWSELSTTNYTKGAWRPTFGGGKDFFYNSHCASEKCGSDFSMRLSADYVLTGTDWQNGSQGPLITVYIPSPAAKGHLFWRESVGIYRFHDTVTNRSDAALTRLQMGNRSFNSFAEFTVMYRF